jgi:hypothetical protein
MNESPILLIELNRSELGDQIGGFLFGPPTPIYIPSPSDLMTPDASAAGGGETVAGAWPNGG